MAALFAANCIFWCLLFAVLFIPIHASAIGAFFGLLIGVVYWMMCAWASEKFMLDLYGAQPITSDLAPNLVEMVQSLCDDAGLEMPLLYSAPLTEPNAFAVTRGNRTPCIVLTNGLSQHLSKEEVRAVIALMLQRLAHPAAPVWTVAATLAGLPLYAACSGTLHDTFKDRFAVDEKTGMTVIDRIVLACIVPPCAAAMRLAISPKQLAVADFHAAAMAGAAELSSALNKISAGVPKTWWGGSPYNPATAMLFAVPPVSIPGPLEDYPTAFCRRAQAAFAVPLLGADERRRAFLAS